MIQRIMIFFLTAVIIYLFILIPLGIIHAVYLRFPKASTFVFLNSATPRHSGVLASPFIVQKSLTSN